MSCHDRPQAGSPQQGSRQGTPGPDAPLPTLLDATSLPAHRGQGQHRHQVAWRREDGTAAEASEAVTRGRACLSVEGGRGGRPRCRGPAHLAPGPSSLGTEAGLSLGQEHTHSSPRHSSTAPTRALGQPSLVGGRAASEVCGSDATGSPPGTLTFCPLLVVTVYKAHQISQTAGTSAPRAEQGLGDSGRFSAHTHRLLLGLSRAVPLPNGGTPHLPPARQLRERYLLWTEPRDHSLRAPRGAEVTALAPHSLCSLSAPRSRCGAHRSPALLLA